MVEGADLRDALFQQADTLMRCGVPDMMGLTADQFAARIDRLDAMLEVGRGLTFVGNIPLSIGIRLGALDLARLMESIEVKGARGVIDMTPLTPDAFDPLGEVRLPRDDLYLLLDLDTGRSALNVSPEASLATMRASGRTPLTIEEGVALAVQHPDIFTDKSAYNCIQMPGSRKAGDQRVPSIWFSRAHPRLGWCWDRNVHTWLGSASAALRVGHPSCSRDRSEQA